MIDTMSEDDGKARLRRSIDDSLKRVYDEALSQEIPERFTALLARLRESEARKKRQDDGDV